MCNDGHDMVPKEKLTVLLQSFRGHRKEIYNYVLEENYELSKTDAGAEDGWDPSAASNLGGAAG